jgi:GAF domain-containing protein/PilZ domain-containing protein/Sel1 repeat-containing protein
MAVMTPDLQSPRLNRRRRVRHRVHTPAYASFIGASKGLVLDLHEIVDISEDGASLQCPSPLALNRNYDLRLDLAEASVEIYTTAQVMWSDASGRAGFRFVQLPESSLLRLRDWLFVNAMASVLNAETTTARGLAPPVPTDPGKSAPRPDFTNTLSALSAVQREVESLGTDLDASFRLIAVRAHALVQATGAAIALAAADPGTLVCRASAGPDAPPVGAKLQVGSGFSGECVRTGKTLHCDDTETDTRVNSERCRALGIRSMIAVPVRAKDEVIGILEAFSSQPGAFHETDISVLQRLAETTAAAVNIAAREQQPETSAIAAPGPIFSSAGSVLFASHDKKKQNEDEQERLGAEERNFGGVRLPRSHLILLVIAAITIALALGFILAPWIQEKMQAHAQGKDQTVLASSRPLPPAQPNASQALELKSVSDAATLEQLRQLADRGDPSAEYALGARYAFGEGVRQNYAEAVRWFFRAAEQGHVISQATLGAYYMAGRGVSVDISKAYFWAYLARAGGDPGSKLRVEMLSSQIPRSELLVLQQQANDWFQQHQSAGKPRAGR